MVVARHVETPEAEDYTGHKAREASGVVSVQQHLRSKAIYNCLRHDAHRALLPLLVKFISLEPPLARKIHLLRATNVQADKASACARLQRQPQPFPS